MGLMSRFEMTPGRHKPKLMLTGSICIALFVGVLMFAYSGGSVPLLPKGGTVVEAEFRTAANVTPGKTPVRVKGVNVGEVEEVERLEGGRGVRVKMRITDDGVDVKRDARADIYWRTLLGFSFYIQLEPGSEDAGLGEDTIPMERTTAQVELDEVLSSLDKPSRDGMQKIFSEFDRGFGDGPSGRSLDALAPSMRQVAPGLDALRGQSDGDLTSTVKQASRFMGALARDESELGQVISNADTTLGVTAARRADLGSVLQNGPSTLDQTKRTMSRLRTTLDVLDPVAEDLRPGIRKLTPASEAARPALRQLVPLLADARPLLSSLRPALSRLGSASRSGVPMMRELTPTLRRAQDKLLPQLEERGFTRRKLYEAIGPVIATVSSSASSLDANGFTQKFQPGAGRKSFRSFCPPQVEAAGVSCAAVQELFALFTGTGVPGGTSRKVSLSPRPEGAAASAASSALDAVSTRRTTGSSETEVLNQVLTIVRGVL